MRKIRVVLCLVVAAMTSMAIAGPSVASATEWTSGGKPLPVLPYWTQEGSIMGSPGGTVNLEGPLTISNALGKWTCTAHASAKLQPFVVGEVTSFEVSGCSGTNFLKGCLLTSQSSSMPWELLANASSISILNAKYGMKFDSHCFVTAMEPSFTKLEAVPDKLGGMSSLTLSGSGTSNLGSVTASGTLNVSPASKYGIEIYRTPISLSGTFGWDNGLGRFTCSVTAAGSISPGNKGEMTSFDLNKSSCTGTGILSGCKLESFTPTALPGAILATEAHQIEVTVGFIGNYASGCSLHEFGVSGKMKLSPDNPSGMSSVTVGGSSTGNGYLFSGKFSVTPAGEIGIS